MLAGLFAGQGSQFVGMAKDIVDTKNIFPMGSDIIGLDIKKICNETDEKTLSDTFNSQIAIFTLSLAQFYDYQQNIKAVAGFSLGEFTAMTAAGIINLEDSFKIILKRGELMKKASENTSGVMYAVLGLDDDTVIDICKNIDGFVEPVNFNCPGQVVIAGDEKSEDILIKRMLECGAKRCTKLPVSGAFHTKQMIDAAQSFKEFLTNVKINNPIIPIYSNLHGGRIENLDLATHAYNHMISPVLFTKMIKNINNDGYINFEEFGPGKTLSGFVKRIIK